MYVIKVTIFHMAVVINSSDWWFDLGAMLHVCNYKAQFKTYEESSIELEVLVDIHSKARVHRKCIVEVNLSFSKKFSWPMLCFSHTWYQEKPICYLRLVLFKYGTLVGNGYATNDMFKLSIIYQYVLVVLILFVAC